MSLHRRLPRRGRRCALACRATARRAPLRRPHWQTAQVEDRPLRLAMDNARFREQYTDAVSALLRDQEQAGLDVVTDGDSRFDDDVAGGSWMMYPARHLAGTACLALD